MRNVFLEQILDAEAHGVGEKYFGDLLHGAGLFDGKARTQNEGESRPENYDDDSHHDVFRDGQFRIAGLEVQRSQKGGGVMAEEVIYEARQPSNVFSHSSARRTQNFPHTCHNGRRC